MRYALIMAGGVGTRLWPLSRERKPKQSLTLVGDRTMFQHAVDRLVPLFSPDQVLVVAPEEHIATLHNQAEAIPIENFIIEPEGRGTAAAIGLAAIHLLDRDPEACMAVLTADHFIEHQETFRNVLGTAADFAEKGYLVTLGIKPTFASTGYGYILQAEIIQLEQGFNVFHVERFLEKPDAAEAARLIESGRVSWNSGMFIWKVKRVMDEFNRQMPELFKILTRIQQEIGKPGYHATIKDLWPTVKKQTIDYGIMEGAEQVAVIPVDLGWVDIGSWSSLFGLLPEDENGNIQVGDVVRINTRNTLIFGGKRVISTIGIDDLVIVDTDDALLICKRGQEQEVKNLVSILKSKGYEGVT